MKDDKYNLNNANGAQDSPVLGGDGVYNPREKAYSNGKPHINYLDTHEIKWGNVLATCAGALLSGALMLAMAKKFMKPSTNGSTDAKKTIPARQWMMKVKPK
ncbi:MAG: hypothetical protein V1728_03510 [Candidatus Micrarchaeota archaeon]